MKTIVVGVDGSPSGESALRWAGELSVRLGAQLVAVHAFQHPFAEMPPEEMDRLVAERHDEVASRWVAPAVEAGATVVSRVHSGDPRVVILETARVEQADLVVLGRTGVGSAPGFLHLGSVVEYAAHHADRAFAVIPGGTAPSIERIVIGLDGSTESLAAVHWCAEVAPAFDATVVAVAVDEPLVEWTPATSPENWRRAAEADLETWTTPLTSAGVEVERVVQRDLHPADGLLGVASARRGDLVVIGTRGIGGFTGLRVGGVTMKVVHRASLPLVLVPPSQPA